MRLVPGPYDVTPLALNMVMGCTDALPWVLQLDHSLTPYHNTPCLTSIQKQGLHLLRGLMMPTVTTTTTVRPHNASHIQTVGVHGYCM